MRARLECRGGVWKCRIVQASCVELTIGLVRYVPVHIAYAIALKWLSL